MKKGLKILLVIAGAVALLVITAALLVSPIAKHYIEKHSKELTGRVITMDKLRFNIFNGSLKIISLEMKESNDSSSFFKFDTLLLDIRLLPMLSEKIKVDRIYLTNAFLNVTQNGESFNFDDLLERFTAEDTLSSKVPEDTSSYEITIKDIRLNGGNILYKDIQVGSKFDLRNLSLAIPEVYFSGKSTNVGFSLAFADGGTLESNLKYNMERSLYDVSLKLRRFSIGGITPYIRQYLKIGEISGVLAADINIKGETEHVMNFTVDGNAALDSFSMTDDKGRSVLTADKATVKMADVNPGKSLYVFNELTTEGVNTNFVLERDSSNNFTYLMREDAFASGSESDTASAPMVVKIKNLITKGTNVVFTDKTLSPSFNYRLYDIDLSASDFDMDGKNKFDIKGKVGRTGNAVVKWSGSMSDMSNQTLYINLANLDLKEFTPYALQYFAYPITRGNASFKSNTAIVSNNIDSKNKMNIFKIEVDKKQKGLKPEYNIPMKTALYILKDKNDKIAVDLPVTGNMNDPKFSYKRIIFKVFVNLIVKVATSPVSFMAEAMGLNPDKLGAVEFRENQDSFTNEQYDSFNEIGQMALQKPELKLSITQMINMDEAENHISLQNLRSAYLISRGQLPEFERVDPKDPKLEAFADSLLAPVKIDAGIVEKAKNIYKERLPLQISELAQKRAALLQEYFVQRLLIKPESVEIKMAELESGQKYSGKSIFKVTFSMPGD